MLTLSQIVFGVNDLEAATARFRAMGFDVLDGGVHPGVGTANRVIPLGAQYLELLGVVVAGTRARERVRPFAAACHCGRRSARPLVVAYRRDRSRGRRLG